jgi:hypothetical protein
VNDERNRYAMKLDLSVTSLVVVTLTAAAACSSSSSSASAADAGTEASGGEGGLIGPIIELNDDGGATVASPIQCGGMTCSGPVGMFPLSPCCLPDNGCGATFGSAALAMFDAGDVDAGSLCLDTSAGVPDTACPSQMTSVGFTLSGCCARSGVCGVDLSVAGLGCNLLSALAGLGAAPSGDGSVGVPQACSPATDGGGRDASEADDGGHD